MLIDCNKAGVGQPFSQVRRIVQKGSHVRVNKDALGWLALA
jgi:hypothetical protein